jgi:hypothetical protein
MPILQQLGIDSGQPTVMSVHKVIVPTAKVTSPRKQAKASARGRSADNHRTIGSASLRLLMQETRRRKIVHLGGQHRAMPRIWFS